MQYSGTTTTLQIASNRVAFEDAVYLCKLLEQLAFAQKSPTQVYEDNTARETTV